MKCNSCHRSATHTLKLGFAQRQGKPRYVIAFETEGGYCRECVGRFERETREGHFEQIVGAQTRNEVAVMFTLRGWGEPKWDETSVEFISLQKPEEALLHAEPDITKTKAVPCSKCGQPYKEMRMDDNGKWICLECYEAGE